ncbi:MAG: DUF1648 domain-containing protein [Acidobacteriota bacterium]
MRVPLALIAFLAGLSLLQAAVYVPKLPPRIASHFDGAGRANGWQPREAFATMHLSITLGASLVMLLVAFLIRAMPASLMNVPHREYWLAPEREAETKSYLTAWMLWFSVLLLAFLLLVMQLVIDANLAGAVPTLDNAWMWGSLGVFLAFVIAWTVSLFRRFGAPPAP